MIEKYYEILGVNAASKLGDIKKAYRQKAMVLHPDVNKTPGAHERFVLLVEAYEYLVDLKSGKIPQVEEVPDARSEPRARQAQERAENYARMKYREFKKQSEHKGGRALEVVADHLNLLFSLILSIVILVALTTAMDVLGFFIGLFLATVILYTSYKGVEEGVDFSRLKKALGLLMFNRVFAGLMLFLVNVFVLLMIGFQTLITLNLLFGLYGGFMLGGLVFALLIKRYRKKFFVRFISLCFSPFLVSLFLLLNYFLSSGPYQESYYFVKETYQTRKGPRESAFIILEYHAYDDFEGIRSFIDFDSLSFKSKITYTFETGLFGWRVMKDYKLQ
jgi:hypothetical protein